MHRHARNGALRSAERIVACGGFNETLRRCEDYDLYLRLSLKHPVASHPTLVADYRWHGANMSADIMGMLNSVLRVQGAFAELARQDPARSRAFDEGREIWRAYYSERCLDRIRMEQGLDRKLASAAAAVRASPRFALGRLASMTVRKLARRAPRPLTSDCPTANRPAGFLRSKGGVVPFRRLRVRVAGVR